MKTAVKVLFFHCNSYRSHAFGPDQMISNDKFCSELIKIIIPQLKNIKIFKKPNYFAKSKLDECDFIFLLSLLVIDETDNVDYFIYKFNLSNNDQKRIKTINNFFHQKLSPSLFTEKNLNKLFYYNGKQAVIDVLSYRLFTLKKTDEKLIQLLETFKKKTLPIMPINAKILMSEFNIPEGKILGSKLKKIEEMWVSNNFRLSNEQINKILSN